MRIGEVAELAGVSAKTIRYYESIGVVPDPPRTESGYRNYDSDIVERIRFIRDAQATGLSLDEIASVLELKGAGERSCEHTAELVHRHLRQIDEQIARLNDARKALAELADRSSLLDPTTCTDPNRCQVIAASG